MRICMVAYTFYEGDNRVRRYAEALVKRGDTVDALVCGQPGQDSRVVISGVNVLRLQTRRINEHKKIDYLAKIVVFLIRSFFVLSWRHLVKPYRLIHVHSVPDFEVFAAVIAKWTGARVVLDIHDIVPEFFAGKFNAGKDSFLSKALIKVEKICCAFSHHVIISNHIWAEKLIARSTERNKCSVILNYPDPAIFNRNHQAHDDGCFSMIYPGSLGRHQGLDIAIQALSLVNKQFSSFRFDIFGRGSEEPALKELTSSLGLTENVHFHGVLPLEHVAAKMAMADLGVVPKRADGFGNEAFSTKILEFMMLFVPVLISSTKIDRYYFNNLIVMFFESGNEHELAEKIMFLAKNKPYRDALVANASQFIKQYNWDVKKGEYFSLVDSLTMERRRKQWPQIPVRLPMPSYRR